MAITADLISELIAVYSKHGWSLRRVLLSHAVLDSIGRDSVTALIGECEVRESDLDAMWFARAPVNGQETWELRVLGSTPFALNEFFDEDDDEEDRESAMSEAEDRMRSRDPNRS